ncbi:MAG: peptidoglycan-binding protein [Clostridia bacterium]|nr:peptidoglycan-binding protein [Clostridia bacterium]
MLLPVTPQKVNLSISGKNQVITLIDEGEINILKNAGLTEISFQAMIPQVKYPFARYGGGGFEPASVFLDYLEKLKMEKKPFQFILSRWMPDGKRLFDTNITVSLEDYSLNEDAKNGFDLMADIRLKQYRAYGAKTIEIEGAIPSAPIVMEEERPVVENPKKSSGSSGSSKSSRKKNTGSSSSGKNGKTNIPGAQKKTTTMAIASAVSALTGRTTSKPSGSVTLKPYKKGSGAAAALPIISIKSKH